MEFKTISLCNTIYKIISKVMKNRLKPLMDNIISKEQTRFIPWRSILEGFIVSQELIHTLQKHEKTWYDSENWIFPEHMIMWTSIFYVKSCRHLGSVSNRSIGSLNAYQHLSFFILVNGKLKDNLPRTLLKKWFSDYVIFERENSLLEWNWKKLEGLPLPPNELR